MRKRQSSAQVGRTNGFPATCVHAFAPTQDDPMADSLPAGIEVDAKFLTTGWKIPSRKLNRNSLFRLGDRIRRNEGETCARDLPGQPRDRRPSE